MSTRTPLPALQWLQARPQWVCWRREERKGKRTKIPYNARTGQRAESNNPATWTSYAAAKRAYERSQHTQRSYDGLGYMFQRDITGIDLDHCIDRDGQIEPWAKVVMHRLASYAERSPGDGIHLYVRGTVPKGIRRAISAEQHPRHPEAAIEMYCEGRYFTVTGAHVEGTPTSIEANQDVLDTLYAELTAEVPAAKCGESQAAMPVTISLDDDLLLKKAGEARNGEKFRALFYDGPRGYPSASEADMALCLLLAFWTGRDTARMDRLYRKSALYRQKWDAERRDSTYGWETIHKAAAVCTVVYDPRRTHSQLERDIEQVLQQIAQHQARLNGVRKRKPYQLTPGEVPTAKVLEYLDMNEYGDALFFAAVFAGQVCYDHTAREWYLWDGHAWKRDATGKVRQLVAGVLGTLYLRAAADLNTTQAELDLEIQELQHDGMEESDAQMSALKEQYKVLTGQMGELRNRAKALRSARRMANVLMFVQSEMGITSDMWDTHPWLLAVLNGVLDLQTGTCRDGNPGDFLRTVAPTEWTDLDTPCPRFERYLQEIFADKPDRDALIAFLQRLLGYAITGLTMHHVFPILYGEEGRNGKDTLLEILKAVLGALVGAVSNDVFIAQDRLRSAGAATPHLVDLQGKRLVWGSETKEGDRLNIAQLKLLTGGGEISARKLHGHQYTFTPTHKLLLITNYKPHADARDKAFWSRACLIEFGLRFIDNPQAPNERLADTTLRDTLKQECSGILAWLVRGCLAWQEQGLAVPESVRLATDRYRDEEDKLLLFIQECCIVQPEAWVRAGALFKAYHDWYEANQFGGRGMNSKLFGDEMKKRFQRKEVMRGRIYQGIGLLANDLDQESLPFSDEKMMEDHTGSMEDEGRPSIGHEPSSGANGTIVQQASYGGYGGLREVFAKNEKILPSIERKHGNTLHTLHSSLAVNTSQLAPEAELEGMEDRTAPSIDTPYPPGESDEGMRLLEALRKRARGVTKLLWQVSESGFPDGYLPRDEFFQRVEDCLTSGDPRRRTAVIAAMKERLA